MTTIAENNKITSRAYRLIQPRVVKEVVLEHELRPGFVAIEPLMGSICHADLRYYAGLRTPEVLARKLPMALIHEGIGHVVQSNDTTIPMGQRVIIVPNLPGYLLDGVDPQDCCPACREGTGGNYCHRGHFLGSGVDGIAQSRLIIPAACAIPIPDDIPNEIAVLAELCSVSYQALSLVQDRLSQARVAVFGDGPVGYLAAAMLHHVFGLDADRLQVFGAVPEKLEQFQFANRSLVQQYNFNTSPAFDIAIECAGGRFSESAINQAIDIIKPGGCLILMGVSEERVPINTRDVLEKNITLVGSSRSSVIDYHGLLPTLRTLECQTSLRRLLPEQHVKIRSAEDFAAAMEEASTHRDWKKTILDFQW